MVNFSDLSKMAGKLDVAGLVKNVKSMVNPDQAAMVAATTEAAGDPLSQKMVEVNAALQSLVSATAQQAEAVSKMSKALAGLSHEIEALKKPDAQAASPAVSAAGATEKPEVGKDKTDENKQG